MKWDPDFWVAAATVAPVLALAHGVNISRYDRWRRRAEEAINSQLRLTRADAEFVRETIEKGAIAHAAGKALADSVVQELKDRHARAEWRIKHTRPVFIVVTASRVMAGIAAAGWGLSAFTLTVCLFSLASGEDAFSRSGTAIALSITAWGFGPQFLVELVARRRFKAALPDGDLPD